jgi:hypothetical protein
MKFEEIAEGCPWRQKYESPVRETKYSCLGKATISVQNNKLIYYECKATYCAPFYFVEKMIPGGDDEKSNN